MSLKRIETEDQSPSLYSSKFDEPYHSRRGAVQESMHVFIEAGLDEFQDMEIVRVFEMGFGTGLNALLSFQWAVESGIEIEYTGIEKFPISFDMAKSLNYPEFLGAEDLNEIYLDLHRYEAGKRFQVDSKFSFGKLEVDLLNVSEHMQEEATDLIYFDAFAPSSQPELWELPVFEAMYRLLSPGGMLTTYCAKGTVRRNMIAAGFQVDKLPGPPGKREMLRARK